MSVVSIRIPDDALKTLHEAGINPTEFLKQAVEREARRIRVLQDLKWLEKHRIKSKRRTEDIIREIRDHE